jgi:hypothetical protein
MTKYCWRIEWNEPIYRCEAGGTGSNHRKSHIMNYAPFNPTSINGAVDHRELLSDLSFAELRELPASIQMGFDLTACGES